MDLESGGRSVRTTFWERHANPKSGWTRVATLPLVVYAVYHRHWRLLALAIVFTGLNPILFRPPKTSDAWMTTVVLAERHWRETEADVGALSLLNLVNVPITLYAIYAAYRRDVGGATVATALSMTLKFAFVTGLVRRFGDDLGELETSIDVE